MTARIFISYRTADGVDKATALARDLGEVFGDETVFIDKDDLRGGSAWRKEIHAALDADPVLLLLVTPQLLSAVDEQGNPRIADQDDPVRRELEGALAAGASIIPILCDGVDGNPETKHLPAPFNCIGELTWRRLRAYDWDNDIERLIDDLRASGIPLHNRNRRADDSPPSMAHFIRAKRLLVWLIALIAVAVALATGAWLTRAPEGGAAGSPWRAELWQGERGTVILVEKGDTVTLSSEPIAIADRPDWAAYRRFWKERGGGELNAIVYRGEGKRTQTPGQPAMLDIALQVFASPENGDTAIDSGNLNLRLATDGNTWTGRIWLNSAQADQPAVLTRQQR